MKTKDNVDKPKKLIMHREINYATEDEVANMLKLEKKLLMANDIK